MRVKTQDLDPIPEAVPIYTVRPWLMRKGNPKPEHLELLGIPPRRRELVRLAAILLGIAGSLAVWFFLIRWIFGGGA